MSEIQLIQTIEETAGGELQIEVERQRYYRPPPIFHILSLGIGFLCAMAVVAGCVSGDWEATFCTYYF
jgi:hypothetical protein